MTPTMKIAANMPMMARLMNRSGSSMARTSELQGRETRGPVLCSRSFFEHRGNQFSTREVSFYEFVKAAWPHFDPAEFSDNWHLKDICDHMQAASFARNGGSSGATRFSLLTPLEQTFSGG